MKPNYLVFIVLLNIFLSADNLKEIVQKDDLISQGQTGFIQSGNKIYLVSVGIGTINDDSTISKVKAIEIARSKAQKGLTNFIHNVTVSSDIKLITHLTHQPPPSTN